MANHIPGVSVVGVAVVDNLRNNYRNGILCSLAMLFDSVLGGGNIYHIIIDIEERIDADVVDGKLQLLLNQELLLNCLYQLKLGL